MINEGRGEKCERAWRGGGKLWRRKMIKIDRYRYEGKVDKTRKKKMGRKFKPTREGREKIKKSSVRV